MPSEIRAEDAEDDVTLVLPPRFQERIDHLALQRGLQDSGDYLEQWHWSDEQDREGSAHEVAEQVKAELESEARW
ncbi:MAG TPA: virulence factor [Bryobacteraceae bacterium]|nr:virulence factor [Bryobacteraceae bacterium]